MQLLFRKWWMILIQGILLIILAIYIFRNPLAALAGISIWVGWLVLLAGLLGIFAWVVADKTEKENMSLLWSILTALFGFMLLMNLLATMKTLTILFGIWVVSTGVMLARAGWHRREGNSLGWILLIAGVLSVILGVMMIFNIGTAAAGISAILGIQLRVTGLALILLSFVKKQVTGALKDKFNES